MCFVVQVVLALTLQVTLSGKATIIVLTVGLMKKIKLYKISCFLEPHTNSKNKIEIELNLYNHATKSSFKKRIRC